MHKNPWFTLVLGAMVGLVLGYVLAERQQVRPAGAAAVPQPAAAAQQGLPEGHPPVDAAAPGGGGAQRLAAQAAELEGMLARSPGDPRLMIALGNLYFDAGRWTDARLWYERAMEIEGGDPNVITDLAVVYRNLKQPERSLALLDQAIAISPEHWQAVYNKVVVLHFDLHRHDEAAAALARLKEIKATNPEVPDLSSIEAEVAGS
ncbi:MAG TPA: tetratricopeptide repeat protein [Thermoanaerobaculales bacterium]|nr:tetratricopeptide repeat protein [Thermoanaerobaculales bacterium]HPA79980.1 tetratricopeptide repeat protein [Thermoanaerobaculales bacterium]HQL30118.1 tetratricopeptide repeat protein [Thermoanaerobaculales bacterium]HQN94803.1 tetratricopeptide repeat protein [Thermoanaerobaculales bacterium]HQP43159.1 tetratricopeptide repeat protein [Thermoanaerobaculales bacterium]